MRPETSSAHPYLPFFGGWRGIANLIVLLHHFAGFGRGDIGFQVFFVLPGKLLSQVLFVDNTSLRTFYRRRVAQQSYVLLSLVAVAASRQGVHIAKLLLPLLAAGCLVAYALYSAHPPAASASPAMLRTECAAFALMLSASLHLHRRKDNAAFFWPALTVTLLLLMADMFGTVAINPIRLVLLPAALAVLINVLDGAPRAVLDLLSAPWLRWFGVVSYSLYIWQHAILWLSMRGEISQSQAGLLAILTGAVSYYGFELPMRSWIRNRRASLRSAVLS